MVFNQDQHEMKNVNGVQKLEKRKDFEDGAVSSEYKDVVIIGNGPSGIALSYILDGNIPYYNQLPHPDEMLNARLQYISSSEHLLEQDLSYLAAGLEGRSTNPISLLLDALEHPNADLGIHHPSVIKWQKQNKKIDHVVLGKGLPGGSWHAMDPHILTLSLGSWMALPGLPYPAESTRRTSAGHVANYYMSYVKQQNLEKYFHTHTIVTEVKIVNKCKRKNKIKHDINSNLVRKKDCTCCEENKKPTKRCRLICCKCCVPENVLKIKSCACLLDDYRIYDDVLVGEDLDFVTQTKASLNQINSHKSKSKTTICSILDRSQSFTCDKRNYLSCSKFCYKTFNNNKLPQHSDPLKCTCDYKYQVTGYDYHSRMHFTYYAKNLVLATGSSDQPNRLGIQGEDEYPEFVKHNLWDLEEAIGGVLEKREEINPVLVVGAGLSAADAVIVARGLGLSVLHVFRKKNSSLDKQLPENMYPEYHKVHKMMSDTKSQYPLYTALPEQNLIAFDPVEQTCTLENTKTKHCQTCKVSYIAILIGSRPNLNFLPSSLNLGVNKKLAIDCKLNPLDINPLTHQIANYEHLYALGPLAGDNFVRFIPGGALAIASDLFKNAQNIP